jgi:hypothetical protein
MGDAARFTFIASDILFLRRCSGLFACDSPLRFMVDPLNACSLRPWQLRAIPLPARINVGIAQIMRSAYGVDFLEWFVGEARPHALSAWIEQAAWVALGQRQGGTVIDSAQIHLLSRLLCEVSPAVALHVVTPQRHRLPHFVAPPRHMDGQGPIALRSVVPGPCRSSAMRWERVRHALAARRFQRH